MAISEAEAVVMDVVWRQAPRTARLSFNDMPAGTALRRVADIAGMKLVLDGKRVRFAPK